MIESRLSIIMAERKVFTLKSLSDQTGLSRTSLTNLFYGKGDGIRFQTLDVLCKALNIGVGELLQYREAN